MLLVSEKMDGANAGIVRTPNGLLLHSRNTIVAELGADGGSTIHNAFRGFVSHVEAHRDALLDYMDVGRHVYGEWLVPHTLKYPTNMYNQFYAFPTQGIDEYWPLQEVHWRPTDLNLGDDLNSLPSDEVYRRAHAEAAVILGDVKHDIEGVVFTDGETGRAWKLVLPAFKDTFKTRTPTRKDRDSVPIEDRLASTYTARQFVKMREKAQDLRGEPLTKGDTPMILGLCWNDFVSESLRRGLDDNKLPTVDTRALRKALDGRVREMFHTELDTGLLPNWALEWAA